MRQFILILSLLVLSACAVYRVDVPQGNVLTAEMKQNLKPGMNKRQVRFLLGSPSLNDPFHPDRWDYIYRIKKGDGSVQQEQLSLTFSDDRLIKIEGLDTTATAGANTGS